MAEKTKGYVEQIVFRNEENGYTVLSLQTAEDEITCVGIFPQIHAGEFMEVEGERVTHPVYGDQLKVSVFHTKMPDEKAAFERYLGSGAIKGIGEKLAERILRHFGEETQEILEHEPERLSEVKGISEKKSGGYFRTAGGKITAAKCIDFFGTIWDFLSNGIENLPGISGRDVSNPKRKSISIG